MKNSFSQQAIAELNRAQQKTAQNREVSQLSSETNIAQSKPQESPQTTQSVEIQPQSAAAENEIKGKEQATKSEALADELLAFGNVVKSIFNAQYKTLAEILFPNAYKTHLDLKEVANLAYKAEKAKMSYKIAKNNEKNKYALFVTNKKENLDEFYKAFKVYFKAKFNKMPYTEKTLKDIQQALKSKGYELKM